LREPGRLDRYRQGFDHLSETPAIEFRRIGKKFGRQWAVRDVTFSVPRGSLVGLLGPNGSGKTTSLRMLLGLIRPSEGEIAVLGNTLRRGHRADPRIGSLIDPAGYFPDLSARQHLEQLGNVRGLGLSLAQIERWLEKVRLDKAGAKPARTFSSGMKRRLAIAMALMGEPEVVVLDEPTSGLDPLGIRLVRELLREIVSDGRRSALVSSHLLGELEQECDRVVMIHEGSVVADGTVAELLDQTHRGWWVQVEATARDRAVAVLNHGLVARAHPTDPARLLIEAIQPSQAPGAIAQLVQAGVPVVAAGPDRATLEDFFLLQAERQSASS